MCMCVVSVLSVLIVNAIILMSKNKDMNGAQERWEQQRQRVCTRKRESDEKRIRGTKGRKREKKERKKGKGIPCA